MRHVTGSILDPGVTDRVVQGCSTVFHLAGLVNAGQSQNDLTRYFEVNCLGTAHMLSACANAGVGHVVLTSTCHVYGRPRLLPVNEDHPCEPDSVYAASKLAAELAVRAFSARFGIICTIARLANVYGAPFGAETVIGKALRQAISGGPLELDDLTPVRDFIYLDDVTEALVRLAKLHRSSVQTRIVNVSTGRGCSIREMLEQLAMIAEEENIGLPIISEKADNTLLRTSRTLVFDNTRLEEITGWRPSTKLVDGLRNSLRELGVKG